MSDTNQLFELLKRRKNPADKKNGTGNFFVQILFNAKGAYLRLVDVHAREIQPDYQFFSGYEREFLREFDKISGADAFSIEWDSDGKHVYLNGNEYLLRLIRKMDNLLDSSFSPLIFNDTKAKASVEIIQDGQNNECRIFITAGGEKYLKFNLLSERHVICNDRIFPIEPLGTEYLQLPFFNTVIAKADTEKYLSLLCSNFENINVKYEDYKFVHGGDRHTRPAIIFEKIGPDGSLFLRISISIPGTDPLMLEQYEISKIVFINELERSVVVSSLIYGEVYTCFSEISKLLAKHKKEKKGEAGYYVQDNFFIIDEKLARAFIHKELSPLMSKYTIIGSEQLKDYSIRTVSPGLRLSLSSGIDYLEGSADIVIAGQSFSLGNFLTQYKKQSYITLNDGTSALVSETYINRLRRLFKREKDKVKVSFFDLPFIEEMTGEETGGEAFRFSREVFDGFNTISARNYEMPGLNASLREYQVYGYKWCRYLHEHSLSGCLADDMGLGKTIQAIALLSSRYPSEEKSSLIIMPRSLLYNWENEIKKFNPSLTYYTYHGTNRSLDEALKHNIIITTYATVRNDIESFMQQEFHYVILDESQNIKNIDAKISRSVFLLKSSYRLALSGTPIENNLLELYSLFRFLNPAMFGSAENFNEVYASPIQKDNDREALTELRKKIYPFILRRMKRDVLKDLPDKIEQTIYVEMSDAQKRYYEQRRVFFQSAVKQQIESNGIRKSQFFILQAITELRQIASNPESKTEGRIISSKREALLESVTEAVANGHKALIFTNFLNALDTISEDLDTAGIEHLTITGATRNRQNIVDSFQNEDDIKVLLMTLKTGGLGLNLTSADHVFIYDPWWNITAENQAIDRAHRIGQDNTVFSYKLITKDSIEEKILSLQQMKKQLFDELIESDGASVKFLTEHDIEYILGE